MRFRCILSFGILRASRSHAFVSMDKSECSASRSGKTLLVSTAGKTTITSCETGSSDLLGQVQKFLKPRGDSAPPNLETYHLIWSPGAWEKIVLGTASLFVTNAVFSVQVVGNPLVSSTFARLTSSTLFAPLSSLISNVFLPLAASACCMIQIGINLLAGGCAGFNTILGPTRPFFLSLLIYLTVVAQHRLNRKWYLTSALRWSISLLPEVVDLWNRYSHYKPIATASATTQEPANRFTSTVALPSLKMTVKLDIPTMGCVACISKIDAALRQAAPGRVVEATSFLNPLGAKGGQASIQLEAVQSPVEMDQILESLIKSVQAAGFDPCGVESIKINSG
jgi:copper chaperone CopZ